MHLGMQLTQHQPRVRNSSFSALGSSRKHPGTFSPSSYYVGVSKPKDKYEVETCFTYDQ